MKQTINPPDSTQLLHSLVQEYPDLKGQHNPEPREDAIFFIASKMHLSHDVAKEVLEDLEAAGYAALTYDPQSQLQRLGVRRP